MAKIIDWNISRSGSLHHDRQDLLSRFVVERLEAPKGTDTASKSPDVDPAPYRDHFVLRCLDALPVALGADAGPQDPG